mgnify:CR=1 FL=1
MKRNKSYFKRALSCCLALAMVLTMVGPIAAFAAPDYTAGNIALTLKPEDSSAKTTDLVAGEQFTVGIYASGQLNGNSIYGGVMNVKYDDTMVTPSNYEFQNGWEGDVDTYKPASGSKIMFSAAKADGQGTISTDPETPTEIAHVTFTVKNDVDGAINLDLSLINEQGDFITTDEAYIAATATNATAYTAKIPVSTVEITEGETLTIDKNNQQTLHATVSPENATYKNVTWSSDNDEIVSVNASTGQITAVAKGTTNIKATADGVSDSIAVTVNVPLMEIKIDPETVNLYKDGTKQLNIVTTPEDASIDPATATWESSAPGYVEVSDTGLVTAIKPTEEGSPVTITATLGGKIATASVTVLAAEVTGVTIDPTSGELMQGLNMTFTATVQGNGDPSQDITWTVEGASSANTKIENGVLTIGEDETAATLTVKATSSYDSSKFATATITVIARGDFNHSGNIDTLDKKKLLEAMADTNGLDEMQKAEFDLNHDGNIDTNDKKMFLDILAQQ